MANIKYKGAIGNAPYKKHFRKIRDFDGGRYKKHVQNWQFDVSLFENFRRKVYLFHHFLKNFRNFFQNSPIEGHEFFLDCYFWLEQNGLKSAKKTLKRYILATLKITPLYKGFLEKKSMGGL